MKITIIQSLYGLNAAQALKVSNYAKRNHLPIAQALEELRAKKRI